ncbi:uncharacterized protein LOC118478106 [Aplysia californica]|uniref:Uncharacterized protein LOC118478106 n=1 Tax=Aplysia californica TaxID=6500 RepID=A0ABM1VX10_APLCA|nr:uncharacterized protein LOC118478106 [Aplysia californica]
MSGHNNSSVKISRWPPYHLPVEVAVDPKRYAPVIKLMFDIYLCRLHRAQRRRPGPPPVWGKPVKAGNHEQDCLKVKPKRRGREHFQRVLKASKDQEKEDAHSNEGAITEENDLLASEGGYYDEPVDVRNRKKIVGVCTYDKSALELNTDKCTGNGEFEFHGSSSDVEQKEVPARKGLRHRATTSRGVRYKESSSLGEQESEVERKIHKEKSPDSEWRPESKKRSSQEGPLFKGIRNKSKRGKRRQPKDIHDKEEESNGRGGKRRQRNADLDDDEVNYGKEGKGLLSKVDNDGDEDIPQQQQVDVMEWLSTKKAIKTYERVRPKKPKTQAWRMRLYGRLNRKHAKEAHESLDDSDEVVEMNEEIEEVTKNSIAAEHVTHKDVSFALSDEDRFATDEILASKRRKGSLGRIESHEPPKKDENEIKESGRDKSNISKDEFTAVDNVLVLDNDMISLRDKDELKLASLVTGEATRGGEEITSSSQGASGSGVPNSQSSNYMIDMNGDMYCTQVAHRTRTAQCNKNLEQAVKKQPAVKQKGGKGRLKDNVPIKVASGEDSDSRSASGSSKELNEEVVLEKDSSDSKLVPVVNLEDSYPNDKNHASKPEIRTVTVPELDASTEEKHQSNKGLSTRKRKLLSAEGTFVTAEVQPTEGTDAAIGREKRPRQMHHQMVSLTEPETPVRSVRARRIDRKTEVVSGLGDNTDVEEKVSKGPVENVEAENVLGPSTSAAEDCQVQQAIMFSEQEMSKDEGWCPLCNKMFPQKDLEEHASTCGEEPAPEPLHERCMVCNAEVATGKMRVHQIHCSKEFSAVSPARVTRHRTANQPTTSSDDVALVFASNKD